MSDLIQIEFLSDRITNFTLKSNNKDINTIFKNTGDNWIISPNPKD